jgi:hypothetical protein
MDKRLLTAVLCIFNFGIGCLYLSPLRNRPVWDLPQFYFAGRLVAEGKAAELYNRPAYTGLIEELRKIDERASKQSVYFNRPAFEALLFIPLALFSFQAVRILAIVGNLLLLALLVWKMPQWLDAPPGTRIWLFVFMPFLYSVAFGQDTLVLTLVLSFGLHLLLRKREIPAGALFALAAFKPHLIWAIPIALLAAKRWKALYAYFATGAVLGLISLAMVGTRGMRQWLDLLQAPTTDSTPMLMGNVRALGLHFGSSAVVGAAVAALICFLILLKRGRLADQFSAAILVGLLLSPHTYRQDYCLMAIVALSIVHPLARYLILLPWPYFYAPDNIVAFILLALGCLATLAADAITTASPAPWPFAFCIRPLTAMSRLKTDAYRYVHPPSK